MPHQTSHRLKRSALLIDPQDNNTKLATDENIREFKTRRNDTFIGTWNVRTLREKGKLQEITLYNINGYIYIYIKDIYQCM